MAVGDKIYLADKQTLDEAKSNTETIKASLASTNSKLDLMDTKVSTKAEQSTVNTIDANVKTANTNINTLNTKVGVNNDAAGTTTVFSRLKQIYDYLTGTMLAAINNKQANWGATTTHRDRIDTTISSRASQATVNTINSNVNSIKSFTDRGVVKSIQRGVLVNYAIGNDGKDKVNTVTISSVNLSKAIVILSGDGAFYSSGSTGNNLRNLVGFLSSNTTLNIHFMQADGEETHSGVGKVSWQVIEFY